MSARTVGHSLFALAVIGAVAALLAITPSALLSAEPFPEDPLGTPGDGAGADRGSADAGLPPAALPELVTSSGSPLLLEILVAAPPAGLREIIVETDDARLRFDVDSPRSLGRPDLPPLTAAAEDEARTGDGRAAGGGAADDDPAGDGEAAPLAVSVTPFLEPGVYDVTVTLAGTGRGPAGAGPGDDDPADARSRSAGPGDTGAAPAVSASYEVGFVDFVWGRDNYRFGNNRDYESRIGDYSEILADWLETRFGGVEEAELALLVHYMYGMFGENAGRCYAFAGTQLRYFRDPSALPRYVDTVYGVRERSTRAQREMNELQLDMVYDYFVAGGAPAAGRQSLLDIARELARIRERIAAGSPVVTGYISPDLHHAMLVYGYILDRARGRVDLLVANNWKSGQDVNARSLDAETVRIDLSGSEEQTLIEWRNREGPRRRSPHRLFIVPVREGYDHARAPLEGLIASRLAELRARGRQLLVVENADEAWVENAAGEFTGYRDNHERNEIEVVSFDRLKESVLFDLPADANLLPRFRPAEGEPVRLFHVAPGEEAGARTGWITTFGPPEAEAQPGTYRLELEPEGPAVAPTE
jgi:hypothetical protein